MLNRAYSLLDIKEVDDDARIITGIASTPITDRVGDIIVPGGAEYKLPLPLLWQHDSRQPLGHVTAAKVTKNGIQITAKIAKGVTAAIDEAWALIKAGLVRGLSIGFRPLDTEQIPNSFGLKFNSWEWLELSAVTIPANADASIQTVKSIDSALLAASGHEQADARPENPAGASAKTKPVKARGKAMKTIAEQIASFEEARRKKSARMDELMEASAEKGETLDAEQKEEYDGLAAELKEVDEHLVRLHDMEKRKATTAKAVERIESVAVGSAARAGVTVKAEQKLPPGIAFTRQVKARAIARLEHESPRDVAKALYGEDSGTFAYFAKTAVAAGTTADATWAGALISDEGGAAADFVEFLRPQTILGKFGANGVPSLRRVPFRRALLGQTSGGEAYWVGEGKPKPLTKFDFSRTTLEPLKVANIAVVTDEVLRDSSPSAEMLVRDSLAAAIRQRLDIDFIDPDKAVSAGVSPASITNGITPITSDGNDADGVREDIKALFAGFIADDNPPTAGVWIMSATTALSLSLMQNPLGQSEFPGVGMNGGTLFGLPVIVSEYITSDSDGHFVFLVNASDIYLADEGGIRIDMSREASLQMNDNPTTQDATTGTGTSLVSLWQTNTVGFLAERTINWARRRAGAVAALGSVNWGTPVSV